MYLHFISALASVQIKEREKNEKNKVLYLRIPGVNLAYGLLKLEGINHLVS